MMKLFKWLLLSVCISCSPEHSVVQRGNTALDGVQNPTPPTPAVPVEIEPSYESLRDKVFAARCITCHDSLGFSSSYDFSTYEATISYAKLYVILADGSDSRFVKSLVSGFMPKGKPPLAPEVIEVVRQWVALGMPQKSSDIGKDLIAPF